MSRFRSLRLGLLIVGLTILGLSACDNDNDSDPAQADAAPPNGDDGTDGDDDPDGDNGTDDSDNETITLSGTLTAPPGIRTDGDVNAPQAPVVSNDTPDQAQGLIVPVTLGGYVNRPGAGPPGRSQQSGDRSDFFRAELASGQTLQLFMEARAGLIFGSRLELVLYDAEGVLLDSTAGTSKTKTLTAPDDGQFVIEVRAARGASNYLLSVGQSLNGEAPAGLRLNADFVPNELIVRPAPRRSAQTAPAMETRNQRWRLAGRAARGGPTSHPEGHLGHALRGADPDLQARWRTLQRLMELRRRDDIRAAAPNYRRYPQARPDDPFFDAQWHYEMIRLPAAWDITQGGPDSVVAVVDTGVLDEHPDLEGKLLSGYDFVSDRNNSGDGDGIDPDPSDPGDAQDSFHGTHVSGTIAAATDNGQGVAGAGWGIRVLPMRALGINGGTDFDIEQAIRYAVGLANDSGAVAAQTADVINLSLGGPESSPTNEAFFEDVRDEGVFVVAAAGNQGKQQATFPAAYDSVLSVSAVDLQQEAAFYSNFGPSIDLAAPGGDLRTDRNGDGVPDGVLSTLGQPNGDAIEPVYVNYQGTSMAVPHVAAVLGLMRGIDPDLTPAAFEDLLAAGAITQDLGDPGRDDRFGHGLIDARLALEAVTEGPIQEPDPEILAVPAALNFGASLTRAQLRLENGGGGELVLDPLETREPWLTLTPQRVSEAGLGTYRLEVDRSGLDVGSYQTQLTVQGNAPSLRISIIMEVTQAGTTAGDAGYHFVLLVDAETGDTVEQVEAQVVADQAAFEFTDVTPGTYQIVAGTDNSNDGFLCESAESCGFYPLFDPVDPQPIEVTEDRDDLDFVTTYNPGFADESPTDGSGFQPQRHRRAR